MGIIIDEFTPQELASERAKRQPREGGRFVKREAEPEPESNPQQDAADAAFMARNTDDGAEQPPESQPGPEQEGSSGATEATAGAALGFAAGGPAGAAVGAAAGFLLSKITQTRPSPIGTLSGSGAVQDSGNRDLADLLAVTKQIARAGTPIKNAILTKAIGTRI